MQGRGTLPPGHQPEPLVSQNAESRALGTGCQGNRGAGLPGDLVPGEGAGLDARQANEAEGSARSPFDGPPTAREKD